MHNKQILKEVYYMFSSLLAPTVTDGTYYVYLTVSIVFIVAMFIAAVAAIIFVLLQDGNSNGIDALGGSSDTFYGKNKGKTTESKMKKWTYITLAVLAVLAIIFFILQISAIWEI